MVNRWTRSKQDKSRHTNLSLLCDQRYTRKHRLSAKLKSSRNTSGWKKRRSLQNAWFCFSHAVITIPCVRCRCLWRNGLAQTLMLLLLQRVRWARVMQLHCECWLLLLPGMRARPRCFDRWVIAMFRSLFGQIQFASYIRGNSRSSSAWQYKGSSISCNNGSSRRGGVAEDSKISTNQFASTSKQN